MDAHWSARTDVPGAPPALHPPEATRSFHVALPLPVRSAPDYRNPARSRLVTDVRKASPPNRGEAFAMRAVRYFAPKPSAVYDFSFAEYGLLINFCP